MKALRLSLLGGFRCERDGEPLELTARKAKALLAFLALHPGTAFSRDRLAALLWEDSGEERARHSLRQALATLRKVLGTAEHVLQADGDDVSLDARHVHSDVAEFHHLADGADDLEAAVALYRGDLLEGFAARAPGFEDWLMGERSRLRERALAVMTALLERQAGAADAEPAIQLGLRLLALDPLREPVHRLVMQLFRRQGRIGAALRQYRRCQGLLLRELGVAPESETRDLYQALLRERNERPAEPAPAPAVPTTTPAPPAVPARPLLRHCVVLVASLARPTHAWDPEALLALSEHFHATVERQVESYGGRVASRLGDTVLAVFGVPLSRGNEPRRAMRAAFALQRALALGPPACSAGIGLASGRVLVSAEGSGLRCTGEAVNSAAALAAAAGAGETLAGDAVMHALGTLVESHARHPAGAGGAAERWLLVEKPLVAVARPGFVGRRAERRQFIAAIELCLESGAGQSFLVRGEAGLGKSRLLEQVASDARERGVSVFGSSFLDFGAEVSQHGIRGLARALAGADRPDTGDPVQRLIDAGIIDETQRVLLNDLLGIPQTSSELALYDAMDPAERHARLSRMVAQVVRRMARQGPLLVFLEDVHWVEPHLLPYLAALGAAVSECPAVLVMTSRIEGEPLDPAWRGAMRNAALTTMELAPMRDEDALTLAAGILGAADERARRCVERAQGRPLFIEQLARAGGDPGDDLPDNVQSVIWWRLDRLPPGERHVAQVASILGQHFPRAALQELAAADSESMQALIAQGLLVADGDALAFTHALVRDGIYATLLRAERAELHRRAARWFRGRDAVLVAEHLEKADAPEAADAWHDAAGEYADLYRYDRALRLVERGLGVARTRAARYRLTSLLGHLQRAAGHAALSLASYETALSLAGDGAEEGQARIGIVAALRLLDRHDEALGQLDTAEQVLGPDAGARELARIWHYRGRLLFPLGRVDECLHAEEQALAHARAARSPSLTANALSGLGDAWYQRGRMLTARSHYQRCLELAREHGLGRIVIPNLTMHGLTRYYALDMAGGDADTLESIELAEEAGERRAPAIAYETLASASLWRGDLDAAQRSAEHALERARSIGARRFEVDHLCLLAAVAGHRGDRATGLRLAAEAAAIADEAGRAYCWPRVLAAQAALAEDFSACRALIDRAREFLDAGSVSHNHFEVLSTAIEQALRHGAWDEAERFTQALADYTAAEPLPWTTLLVDRARVLAAHGREPGSVAAARIDAPIAIATAAGLRSLLPALEAARASLAV